MKKMIRDIYTTIILLFFTLAIIFAILYATSSFARADSPAYKAEWDVLQRGPQLTSSVILALDTVGKNLMLVNPDDSKTFCPQLKKLTTDQRRQFYLTLISAMAQRESGFKSESTYKESFKDAKGKNVISRGLLQISYESAKAYGCELSKPEDLHDDNKNLTCGVMILNRWIPKDNLIGSNKKGGGRYWSVLRESSDSRAKIISKLRKLDFCN